MTTLVAIVVVLLGLALYGVAIFNRLVALKNDHANGFAQIEVQLKRRYDLIPNLVNAVKGAMAHERETLAEVISARNQASEALSQSAAGETQAISQAERRLGSAMSQFSMVMEDYPDLRATENMVSFQEELATTENRVAFARQAYNDAATDYNAYRQSFPNAIIANRFGHQRDLSVLEMEDSAVIRDAPTVNFG